MFVMTHGKIAHALAEKIFFTYTDPVINYCPQKDNPYQIQIMEAGNSINYDGKASVQTADLDMAKLHWNSVVSMENARYMCLDTKKNYLTKALEYFEYMKIPLALFPAWTIEQYKHKELAFDGWVYIEMRQAV